MSYLVNPFIYAAAGGGGDPSFSSVVLLLDSETTTTEYPTPSYANPQGTGNRTTSITATTTATAGGGNVTQLLDGTQTNSFFFNSGQSGREVKFDFGAGLLYFEGGRVITEAKWYQDSTASHGTWKWQGSNDNSAWTDIGATFTLGGVATQTITTLSANTTQYRYYRMLQTAGTTSNGPYLREIEFKIGGTYATVAFVDKSSAAHVLTANGNAQKDTAQFKFDGYSALFDGSGDYISSPDSADWRLSAANADPFTVEAWVRQASTAGSQTIVCQNDATDANMAWQFVIVSTGALRFQFSINGSVADTTATSSALTWTVGQWYHVAADKDATGKIRVYRDGTMVASSTPANSAMFNSTTALTVGAKTGNNPFNGHIDELRITKGVARYASDSGYTVPTAAFPRT